MTKKTFKRFNMLDNLICKHCGHDDHRGTKYFNLEDLCSQDECYCQNCKTEDDLMGKCDENSING